MSCEIVRRGYATLLSRMRERLDAGSSGTTNTSRQARPAGSRKPRTLRGFRVQGGGCAAPLRPASRRWPCAPPLRTMTTPAAPEGVGARSGFPMPAPASIGS